MTWKIVRRANELESCIRAVSIAKYLAAVGVHVRKLQAAGRSNYIKCQFLNRRFTVRVSDHLPHPDTVRKHPVCYVYVRGQGREESIRRVRDFVKSQFL